MIISAETNTDAAKIADAYDAGGGWKAANATAPSVANVAMSSVSAFVGWKFRVVVYDPAAMNDADPDTSVVADVTVEGPAGASSLDQMGALLVTALNAVGPAIDGAAYASGSPDVLKVADGTPDDGLGDHAVLFYAWPAALADGANQDFGSSFVASITDGGAATDDLLITFKADTVLVPRVVAAFRKE
jgi:hypothetical protein